MATPVPPSEEATPASVTPPPAEMVPPIASTPEPPAPAASPTVAAPTPETIPAPTTAATPGEAAHPLETRDLETFFDGLIPPQLLLSDTAGVTVCVVKDGEPLLTKGYGYADFKAGKPVSGEETLFRPGSISKTFTAVAIMQLVEGGQLNLDRDVNDYLDFRLPARKFPQFLTLRQLLTHTAGFEEGYADLFIGPKDPFVFLRDYVMRDTPPQIFSPGTVAAYSNYGMALAGYVVERVSKEPFADYVATHIFGPLGMTHASFAQPPPEPLGGSVSAGYHKADDKEPIPFERVPGSAAGGLSVSAADMSRFMRMLLDGGTLDGKQILTAESVKALFARQHEAHTSLNAMGLAFYSSNEGGRAIVGHGGALVGFYSDMFLLPGSKTGLFISVNSASGDRILGFVRRAFLDRYFPVPPAPAPAAATDTVKADARAAAGQYQSSRRVESNFAKVANVFEQTSVLAAPDGSLTISAARDLRGHLIRWDPVAGQPLVYQEHGGPRLIAFQRDASKAVATLFTSWPGAELQRVPWYENWWLVLPPVGVSLALLLLTVLLWPVAGLVRRRYARPAVEGWTARIFFVLTRLVCAVDAAALLGWIVLYRQADGDPVLVNGHHLPWQLPTLYNLGRAGAAGGVLVLIGALLFLLPRFAVRRYIRWQQWLLAAACTVFALFAWHWHLLV